MNREAVAPSVLRPTRGNRPPGPHGPRFWWEQLRVAGDSLGFLQRLTRDYGDIIFLRLLTVPALVTSDPEAVEQVLVTNNQNFTKSQDYRALHAILGEGLLTSEGDMWKRHRKLVQPAFFRERIVSYGPLMTQAAERVAAEWQHGEVRDMHRDMMRITLEIAARSLFDIEITGRAQDIGTALGIMMEDFMRLTSVHFFVPNWLSIVGPKRFRRALREMESIVYGIIKEKRASGKPGNDLLTLMLEAREEDGSGLSDKELRDEVMTLLLAGHETTANALGFTLYLLAQNPDAEARLCAELDEVLQGRTPRASDMHCLPYTDMVLKESMRLYPPAWAVGRKAIAAFELQGYQLPRGTNVFMSQWIMHRNPRYFPEPERFEPERWSEGSALHRALPKFAYLPFGAGPRVCVGASLALTEATLVLATLYQHYRFRLASSAPFQVLPSVTLRPKDGIDLRVEKR